MQTLPEPIGLKRTLSNCNRWLFPAPCADSREVSSSLASLESLERISQGWGFMAIPVALLGGLHPLGVVVSALFFGAVFAGTENLARFTTGGPTLLYVIQAVAVFSIVAMRAFTERRTVKAEAA